MSLSLIHIWEEPAAASGGFWRTLTFRLEVFLRSFLDDYIVSGGEVSGQKPLKVWINTGDLLVSGVASGRDQMQLIKRLCDDRFTRVTHVPVELSLVSTGDVLMQAVIAGKGPVSYTHLLTGYGFARFPFKGRGLLFLVVIFTIVVPPQMTNLPNYLLFHDFDFFGIVQAATGRATEINLLDRRSTLYLLAFLGQGCLLYTSGPPAGRRSGR